LVYLTIAVDVCPKESYTSVTGLDTLEDCCPNLPGALCRPTCQSGYVKSSTLTTVQCKNGNWNVKLDSICKGILDITISNVWCAIYDHLFAIIMTKMN
jgi:hypothetical protein